MLDDFSLSNQDPVSEPRSEPVKRGIGAVRLKPDISAARPPAPAPAPNSTDGAPKGGEGGDPGLPPSPPSNAAFLAHVTRGVADGARTVVCSKVGDPQVGGWPAMAADNVDRQCPPTANNYVNCSSFLVDEDGGARAKLDRFSGFHMLVLDDVGTKVARDRLGGAVPTWEIETSPGNSQMGFCLVQPIRELAVVERLQGAAIAAGLCDPGAGGAPRWVRLPYAINGKAQHRDAGGKPFVCRLAQWHPGAAYTVDELAAVLGLDLSAAAKHFQAPRPSPTRSISVVIGGDVWTPAPDVNPVLAALRDRSLYKREISPGVHDVTCPWVGEHTDAVDSGSAYFEPTAAHPRGGFKCQHSHGDRYHIGALLDLLGVDPEAARGRARIDLVPGELNRVKRAAELSLSLQGGFYQMGGAIVSVRTDPVTDDASIERLSEASLTAALSDTADWYRRDGRSKGPVRTDPPHRNVYMLLNAGSYDYLPALVGIARQPFFRDDGTLVTTPSYDERSCRFGAFDASGFSLPEPTEAAAREALATLSALLGEFRFASAEDRSATLCGMITAAVRPSLSMAPAFSITASAPGSGKSYLAGVIVALAGPGHAAKVSYPTTSDEASKAMLSALASNPAAVVFDDMQSDWRPFGAVNRMLTSPTITDRVLGTNQNMTVSTRSLIVGTGNNISPVRDMTRRVVTIRLHHRVENPALERYEGNPAEMVAKHREAYVSAALTIVASWRAAGSPRAELPSIASYGEWSDACRQSLVWLGLPDPATSLIAQLNDDPDRDSLGRLLVTWHEAHGDAPVEVRALVDDSFGKDDLKEALADLPVNDRDSINRSKLGWYLKQNANRVVGGYELQQVERAHRRAWRVVRLAA